MSTYTFKYVQLKCQIFVEIDAFYEKMKSDKEYTVFDGINVQFNLNRELLKDEVMYFSAAFFIKPVYEYVLKQARDGYALVISEVNVHLVNYKPVYLKVAFLFWLTRYFDLPMPDFEITCSDGVVTEIAIKDGLIRPNSGSV